MEIHIGHLEHEFICLNVIHLSYLNARDVFDRSWLSTTTNVKIGCFSGTINDQCVRVEELLNFQNELSNLYKTCSGTAYFSTIENWLSFEIKGDGRGHFSCRGKITDNNENTLSFNIELDQTFLPKILNNLNKIITIYPMQ